MAGLEAAWVLLTEGFTAKKTVFYSKKIRNAVYSLPVPTILEAVKSSPLYKGDKYPPKIGV